MARPLRGTVKQTATGFRVEVPVAIGDPRRTSRTFADAQGAESWRAEAIAALRAGQSVPDAAVSLASPNGAKSGHGDDATFTFEFVARDWLLHYFVLDNKAGAQRATEAESDLIKICKYLDGEKLTPAALELEHLRDVLHQLAGTKEGDLNKRISAARRAAGVEREGYSQQQLADMLRNLCKTLIWARDMHHVALRFDPTSVAAPNTNRPPTKRKAPMTLTQAGMIAAQLHAVHAFTLLICRILALRISEAFGLRVLDYVSDPVTGKAVLYIGPQGGKVFLEGQLDETVARSTRKSTGKTVSSERLLPIGRSLQHLIETLIRIFHTDPETGEVDVEARLIPDLTGADTGQTAFRSALKRAGMLAGFAPELDDDAYFGAPLGLAPHDLRRSLITFLAHQGRGIPVELRERFAGHRAGETVHSSYVLDTPLMDELMPLGDVIEAAIARELPRGLVIPSAVRCTTRSQRMLHGRHEQIDSELAAAGWLVTADSTGDVLDSRQLGELLRIADNTARRLLRGGDVPTVPLPGGRQDQRGIRAADALELAAAWNDGILVGDLAAELGIAVASIHQVIHAKGWPMTKRGSLAVVDSDTADLVRGWQRTLVTIRSEGLSIAAASRELSVPAPIVKLWLDAGVLERLPIAQDYLSRSSVEAQKLTLRRSRRRAR